MNRVSGGRAVRPPRRLGAALAAIPTIWLGVFFAWPVLTLLTRAGRPRVDPGVLWFTVWQATVSTAVTIVVGLPPAYVLARFAFRSRRVVLAAATVPFMLPTVVVGAAFLALLPSGLHGTPLAVIIAHVYFNVAVVVRLVGSMWSVIPHDLTGAARTLGAGPVQVARHIVLPLLAPGIVAAATVVFLFTFTSYGVVVLLGGAAHPTIEAEVVRLATQLGAVDRAVALSLIQLVLLAVIVTVSARLQRRAVQRLGGAPLLRRPRTATERRVVALVALGTATAMSIPVAALVIRSLRPGTSFSLAAWRSLGRTTNERGISIGIDPLATIGASVGTAMVATLISVVIGGLGAIAISTVRRRRTSALDVGLTLPLGTSAVTIGLGMIVTFATDPFDWRGSWWLVPIGHSLIGVPFVVRAVLPTLRAVPDAQLRAAATLGASPLRGWWTVVVRRAARPLLAGSGIAAAVSLGEFGATTFLTRTGRETMPIAISRLLGRAGALPQAQAFALSTLLFALTVVVIVATDRPERDRARG